MNTRTATFPVTVGMREFTRNIATLKRQVKKNPLLVLSNNRPDFVAVDPAMYRTMVAALDDVRYANLFEATVQRRKGNKKISWAEAKKRLAVA
ncbi:MAG: hypothetical protein Q7S16_02200 [bacterium]|nr:hypothetical protein [bacterium]